MFQFVINTSLLRELDENKLINAYARLIYLKDEDVEIDTIIKNNLKKLLDWDENGDSAIGIYCSKFEDLKEKDWAFLISFIQKNKQEIKTKASSYVNIKKLESFKEIKSKQEKRKEYNLKRFNDTNYKVSGRGKKAKSCIYKGKNYKSRQECRYKENITNIDLYKYLKETNQL